MMETTLAPLTNEQKNERIHAARGNCIFEGTGVWETRDGTQSEFCVKCGDPFGYHEGENYFGSLESMHEAEVEALAHRELWNDYELALKAVMGRSQWDGEPYLWSATAAQRAEAFGRTLNLWT